MAWIFVTLDIYYFSYIDARPTKVIVKESLKGLCSSGMVKYLKKGMRKNLTGLKNKAEKI
jgi:hypothetical protein